MEQEGRHPAPSEGLWGGTNVGSVGRASAQTKQRRNIVSQEPHCGICLPHMQVCHPQRAALAHITASSLLRAQRMAPGHHDVPGNHCEPKKGPSLSFWQRVKGYPAGKKLLQVPTSIPLPSVVPTCPKHLSQGRQGRGGAGDAPCGTAMVVSACDKGSREETRWKREQERAGSLSLPHTGAAFHSPSPTLDPPPTSLSSSSMGTVFTCLW